nr:ferritin [Motilibacter peucedani]
MTTDTAPAPSQFLDLLRAQVRNEFTASQQYVAIAVWFDAHDLPQLAGHYYRQAGEERDHAMMMVRYMLDRALDVAIPGVDDVVNDFSAPREPIALALQQERLVTEQIEGLFKAARAEGDVIGEQFVLWFLREQVEEIASASTLLSIAERAGDDWFKIEDFLAREMVGGGTESGAPPVAGALA